MKLPTAKKGAKKAAAIPGQKGGNKNHQPNCTCVTCPLGMKKLAKAKKAKLAALEAARKEEGNKLVVHCLI